jgi:hypothetical protein
VHDRRFSGSPSAEPRLQPRTRSAATTVTGIPCPEPAMAIEAVPFMTTDWSTVPETVHPGESGTAWWRTLEVGNVRVRMVRYSPGYVADHWCERGHVILVLEGELVTELADGSVQATRPGMSYQVGDGMAPHRSRTTPGATLFVVD